MFKFKRLVLLFLWFFLFSCSETTINNEGNVSLNSDKEVLEKSNFEWRELLTEDLSNWGRYISYQFSVGYDGSIPIDESGNEIKPIGEGVDSLHVFTTSIVDDEVILKVSGEYYGCLFTKESFKNYRLKLKFKWGDRVFSPRKDKLKDSGILYHSFGPHGAEYWRSWMLSQEFQVMSGHVGDYWNQKITAFDIRAFQREYIMSPVADHSQPFYQVGSDVPGKGYCMRSHNAENKEGEWNDLELIVFEDKALHIVNNEVVMVLKNSRKVVDGQKIPLIEGQIQLQSEAAELYYKDIKIANIPQIPQNYQALF